MSTTLYAPDLPSQLPTIEWITDPPRIARLSQDFSWFSPVLRRALQGRSAEVVGRPRTEDDISAIVALCARHRIPITVRGSGTGNYGQCVPLHGGVVLDMSAYEGLCWHRGMVARARAGTRLAALDALLRPGGCELRWLPSTFRSATLGGLFGGGFGGAGSINWGPLAAPGNVLGARVMTVEPEPRILELDAAETMLLHHTYGTMRLPLKTGVLNPC
jgi:FAD/FMN-containing dehydrogenase